MMIHVKLQSLYKYLSSFILTGKKTRNSTTAKKTVHPLCLVGGVLYNISWEKIC